MADVTQELGACRHRLQYPPFLLLCEFARKKENPSLERYIAPPSVLSVMY
jgi:hypothetical protein